MSMFLSPALCKHENFLIFFNFDYTRDNAFPFILIST